MSPYQRLTARDGGLLVVDIQDKVLSRIAYRDLVVANAVRLVKAAQVLSLPTWATEQYPEGLGPTVPELAALIPIRPSKTMFHCCSVGEVFEQIHARALHHVTLTGIETHVCVAQTALELLRMGLAVQVPADAVASHGKLDWQFALRRMERAGVVVTTTEAVLFEWTETSDRPEFKAISALVKNFVPPGKNKNQAEKTS